MLYHDRHERAPLELAQESYPVAMFGRDAPRRSARLSPPGAGAPSGASVAKGDIAPVAREPDYRTPGKSLAKRAPWRSPGAALRDRDRENNYVSARKKSVRKLSARSPATAAMASGAARNGRPRFTPAEMKTPSATHSKNQDADDEADDADAAMEMTAEKKERTPLSELASVPVTTVLLTPPSTRSRLRAAKANAYNASAADAEAKAAMPPPPPKHVSPLANVGVNPFLEEATMVVPALAPYNAAFEALQMGTPANVALNESHETMPEPEPMAPPTGTSPALSLFAEVTEVADDSVLIEPEEHEGTSFLTRDDVDDDRSMDLDDGDLPTPTTTSAFDAALDIAAATVAIPAFTAHTPGEPIERQRASSKTPSRDILNPTPARMASPLEDGEIAANEIGSGFLGAAALVAAGATLNEMIAEAETIPELEGPETFEEPETRETIARASPGPSPMIPPASPLEEGEISLRDDFTSPAVDAPIFAGAISADAIAALFPPMRAVQSPMHTAVQAMPSPSPVRRSPRLSAMKTASFTPASPAVVVTDAAPTAAERRAAELQALVEQQALQLLEQREALERQQLKMRSEASRQAAQLEAQREALTNQKRQMENEARLAFQRAQNASEEQARMRAEFQAQLEMRRAEEDATRARLAAMATEAAAAKEEAARAAAAEAARRQPQVAPSPFPLSAVKGVEEELRATREELQRRAQESHAVSQRMQTLQREETELFNRAADLQRRMLELVIKGNPKISPAAAMELVQPLIPSAAMQDATHAAAMPPPPPPPRMMDLSLARPGQVVDAIAAAADTAFKPNVESRRLSSHPMVSMDSLAAVATPGVAVKPTTPLAPMSAGVMRAMEAAVAPSMVDEDGFIVMDYAAAGAGGTKTLEAVAKIGDEGGGVFMTPALTPPAAHALEVTTAAAEATPALVMTPGGSAGKHKHKNPTAAGIATRKNASQIVELRKEVVNLQFLGGSDGGDGAGMLMTATSDGAVRLFAPGSRRAAAMIRGPKDGLTSAVAIGTEAFIASAGRDPHVARHDLATGRELGVLLTTVDGVSPELTCIKGGGAHGGPVVVAAGEGGDVFLWDVRLAPRGGHRSSLGGGAAVPAMTLHVAGAARIHSMSLSNATGGGAHGTAPASLALVASNGGRVFDLRAPGRPARLAALETGQRWVTCAHAGASDDVLTLSAQGDLQAWRSNGGFNYSAHRGVLREVGSTFGSANNRRACVLSASRGETDVMCVTTAGERGDGFRVSDVSTGDVVAEWGGDGERADEGGGGGGLGAGWARRVDEEVSSVTAAGWGVGFLGDAFGGASFAVGTSDGVVRVYGPGA